MKEERKINACFPCMPRQLTEKFNICRKIDNRTRQTVPKNSTAIAETIFELWFYLASAGSVSASIQLPLRRHCCSLSPDVNILRTAIIYAVFTYEVQHKYHFSAVNVARSSQISRDSTHDALVLAQITQVTVLSQTFPQNTLSKFVRR